MKAQQRIHYWLAISAVIAGGVAVSEAQLQVAGNLLISVDGTVAPLGSLPNITNSGTLGGFFEAKGGAVATPVVANVNGNGTRAIHFDGGDFLQQVATLGGPVVSADPTLTGVNPTCTIEAWVLNPGIRREETVVAWGHRGADGRNISFNYGYDDRWGACGHWGGADIGWDPCCNSGTNPQGVPKSGEWHHLVYTYDGTVQRVYSDGVLKNSETFGLNIFPVPAVTIAGQLDDDVNVTADLRGNLAIARLRIHSEALTSLQVSNNYAVEAGGFSAGGSAPLSAPIHRYSFSNPAGAAGGAVVVDSVGGANGTVLGAGATFTGGRLTLPGGASASQGYVDLPNRLLSRLGAANGGSGQITVEGWVKNNGTRAWGRVFDFGNGTAGELTGPGGGGEGRDYFFLSASEGTDPQRHNVTVRNLIPPSGSDVGVGWDTANANRDYHFAVTWDEASGQIRAYENGALVSTLQVNGNLDKFSAIDDVNVWLGRSLWSCCDENFQGEYDEFRIYDRVMTDSQVRGSYNAGPNFSTSGPVSIAFSPVDRTVAELGSARFTTIAQGEGTIGLQWFRNNVELTGSNANAITLSAVTPADNNAEFFVIASNNVGGTSFYATSTVARLTVIADTNPPVLTNARLNDTNVLELVFSEPINPTQVVAAGNYVITGSNAPTVTAAVVGADATRVLLTLSGPLSSGAFYTVTVSNLRDLSAAANVIAPPGNSFALWDYRVAGLIHRYTFNQTPTLNATGSTIVDIVGTAHGVVLGNGSSLTGSRIVLNGGGSGSAAYVDLPNGLMSTNSTNYPGGTGKFTIEGWAQVNAARNWARIFDFGVGTAGELTGPGGTASGSDYLFHSGSRGVNIGENEVTLRDSDPLPDGSATGADGPRVIGTTTFATLFQFAITWDEVTGQVRIYRNGALVNSFNTVAGMGEIYDVNVWLGRSQFTGDENLAGEIDDIRIYNSVLSAGQVAFNFRGGADNNFGAPSSLNLVATNSPYYTNTTRLLPVLVSFGNIGTQDVAGLGLVTYSSSDSNVLEVTSDGVLRTRGLTGSATITASFAGLQDSEVISVTGDAVAPRIVSARANSQFEIEVTYSEPVVPESGAEPLFYIVSTPTTFLSPTGGVQYSDPTKIGLLFDTPLPSDYITVMATGVSDLVGNTTNDNGSASFVFHQPLNLRHRYTFNSDSNALASGIRVPDIVGTAHGTNLGTPVIMNGSRVVLGGGASGGAGYVDLPNGLLSTNSTNYGGSGQVTFEGWVKLTGAQRWSRIFDFGSSGVCCGTGGEIPGSGGPDGIDYLMLTAQIDGDTGRRQFELNNRDQANHGNFVNPYNVTNFGQDIYFVATWDERTGQLRLYENGVLVTSPTTVAAMSEINDVNVWLGRSNWTGDQNTQGEFDDFRIYDRVLTANEMDVNRVVGPDNNFGQPLALRLSVPSLLHAGQAVQPVSTLDFANVSNVNFSAAAVVRIESSSPSVVSVDAAGVLHSLTGGTATITQSYAGFVNTATVTVTNEPPVAGADGLATSKNTAGSISLATLVANDTDDSGGPLSVTAVSGTSTNGGGVLLTSTNVIYTPSTGYTGPDLFTYTVADAFGGSSLGQVYVYVVDGPVPAFNTILFRPATGGGYDVTFRGTPGTTYRIRRTTDLGGAWTTISTQTVPPSGIIFFNDPAPPATQAFYQIITP